MSARRLARDADERGMHDHDEAHDGHHDEHGEHGEHGDGARPGPAPTYMTGIDSVDLAALADREAAQRADRRRALADHGPDEVIAEHAALWAERAANTDRLLAATEELLARMVGEHVPSAATVVLIEDRSHGSPHAHLSRILDSAGTVLVDGMSDSWHDTSWASDADDLIWDIHTLGRSSFLSGEHGRQYLIPVTVG